MRPNKYTAQCSTCGCRVEPGGGILYGRVSTTGQWAVECWGCHRGETKATADPFDDDARLADDIRQRLDDLLHHLRQQPPMFAPCWGVFGLTPPVDEVTVKGRFRELAKQHHPDRGGDPKAFVEVERAYRDILTRIGGSR